MAVHLAREAAPGALVLEAPFSSIVDIASGRFPLLPVGPLIVDRFDSAAKIGKVAAPVLIVHGRARPDHSRASPRAGSSSARASPRRRCSSPRPTTPDLVEFGLPAIVLDFLARHGLAPPQP